MAPRCEVGVNAGHTDLLTPRQLEVVELLRAGLSLKEIAAELAISVWMVKSHLAEGRRRTDSRTNVQLADRAARGVRVSARPEHA